MKRYFLFLLSALSIFHVSFSQDFSTKLYFKDGIGNVDSIKVGYSTIAGDTLNNLLGEKKLLDSQIDTTFFVGISDVLITVNETETAKFRSKTKYVNTNCPDYIRFINVDLICKNYPLTISWDKKIFQDSNRSRSFIIASHPGGWFDVGEQAHWLSTSDSVMYYTTNLANDYSKNYLYEVGDYYIDSIHSRPVKIWRLYVDFASSNFNLAVRETNKSGNEIFPNPCKNFLNIKSDQSNAKFYQIIDLTGKLLHNESYIGFNKCIDVSDLSKGIYLLKIIYREKVNIYKIQKI